jgi:pyruvate formate lyase activating enzyme
MTFTPTTATRNQAEMKSVGQELARSTREGDLYERLTDKKVRCSACGHRCLILDGHDGVCRVRFNRDGTLRVPHGYVAALQCDPIEKKPFFHALPGARAMSFGMLGCDYHCGYCQNWLTSQTLRDPASVAPVTPISPAQFCDLAIDQRAEVVTSTYNEPLITSEWAVEIFREARRRGLRTSYVSNGNATVEVLDYLKPWVDFYKVDLKGFDDKAYRQLGGRLDTVLRSIEMLVDKGFWVEVVTLFVPGFNDSDGEIRDIARFLAGVSPDIPWHCTSFHPDYKMDDRDGTPARTLVRACELGHEAGLRFCYAGNLPGMTGDLENTYCPACHELLVERRGFTVRVCRLTSAGQCPRCARSIPGRWRSTP